VAAIEAVSFRDPWNEHSFREILSLVDTSWVAASEGVVVGYLITQWVLDEIHVLNIAVESGYRRNGVASQLLKMLFDLGRLQGMRDLFLEVRVSNVAAQQTYAKYGFTVLATRKAYYPDGEDALVMHRTLATRPTATEPELDANLGDVNGD
jgi:ribosomal-protein-alanine N-acetyltransferase